MNADGTGQTQLTLNSVQDVSLPGSPDHPEMVFQKGAAAAGPIQVRVMNRDGTEQMQITTSPGRSESGAGVCCGEEWRSPETTIVAGCARPSGQRRTRGQGGKP
jgi:hypothetical protein